MEENNRKGPGVFYAVVGVATLVVAIIGATFAYFSASVTPADGSDAIGGTTQDIKGSDLSLNVEKVVFSGTTAKYNTLVPAYFDKTGDNLNVAAPANLGLPQVTSMMSNKCENDGFTGCHVYRITFSSNQNVTYANLLLGMQITTATTTNKEQWGYALFTVANDSGVEAGNPGTITLLGGNAVPAAIGNGFTGDNRKDIHNNAGLNADEDVVYYLLVYVNDTDVSQNTQTGDPATGDANYVVGSYSGSLELQALGGKVRATFNS